MGSVGGQVGGGGIRVDVNGDGNVGLVGEEWVVGSKV